MDIDKLKALALAASRGPWKWWTSNSALRLTGLDGKDGGVLSAYVHSGWADIACSAENRAFIEASNPDTVLELIAMIPEPESVPVPTTVNMARMMLALGHSYLKENAPEHLAALAAGTEKDAAHRLVSIEDRAKSLAADLADFEADIDAAIAAHTRAGKEPA
jgi:hypothetical protein